jgi:cyclopropane-fatty-acyl-phospholipid synthase
MEKAITRGHLTVADSEGVHHFGTRSKGSNDVYLKVVSSDFWMRVLLYVFSISFILPVAK